MSTNTVPSRQDVTKLYQFHVIHFPGQKVPLIEPKQRNSPESESKVAMHTDSEDDFGLGFYGDGARRTLTDEQISMFRHSEIYRLLQARKRASQQEKEDMESLNCRNLNTGTTDKDAGNGSAEEQQQCKAPTSSRDVINLPREEAAKHAGKSDILEYGE